MTPPRTLGRRRPWLAALLSLLVPGFGRLYAGRPGQAVRWFALSLVVIAMAQILVVLSPPSIVAALTPFVLMVGVLIGGIVLAWRVAKAGPDPFPATRWNRALVYVIYLVIGLTTLDAALEYLIRPHLAQAYRIPSVSMEPTVMIGDYLYVDKLRSRVPVRGRPVVFQSSEEPGIDVLKRIVAIGGDTVGSIDGRLVVNHLPNASLDPTLPTADTAQDGAALARLAEVQRRFAPNDTSRWTMQSWGPLVVPGDHFFAVGDNLAESYDSRHFGPIPNSNVRGWPRVVYWSQSRDGVRWARIGRAVR